MDIPQDTQNDHDWWLAEETDKRWIRHNELRHELTTLTEELKHGISKGHDPIEVPGKGRL